MSFVYSRYTNMAVHIVDTDNIYNEVRFQNSNTFSNTVYIVIYNDIKHNMEVTLIFTYFKHKLTIANIKILHTCYVS